MSELFKTRRESDQAAQNRMRWPKETQMKIKQTDHQGTETWTHPTLHWPMMNQLSYYD